MISAKAANEPNNTKYNLPITSEVTNVIRKMKRAII